MSVVVESAEAQRVDMETAIAVAAMAETRTLMAAERV